MGEPARRHPVRARPPTAHGTGSGRGTQRLAGNLQHRERTRPGNPPGPGIERARGLHARARLPEPRHRRRQLQRWRRQHAPATHRRIGHMASRSHRPAWPQTDYPAGPLHTPQRTRNRREPGFLLVSVSSYPSMTTFAIRSEIHRDVPAVQSADTQFTARLPGRTQAASPGTARRTSTTSTASSRGHSRAGRCDSAPAPRRAPGRCRSRRRASQP